MYVVVSRYTASPERIEQLVPAHRDYLARQFAAGHFVLSGRRIPWDGGVILAATMPRDQLEAILAEDPFAVEAAVESEVVEFDPLHAAPVFEQLLGNGQSEPPK